MRCQECAAVASVLDQPAHDQGAVMMERVCGGVDIVLLFVVAPSAVSEPAVEVVIDRGRWVKLGFQYGRSSFWGPRGGTGRFCEIEGWWEKGLLC